MRAFATVGGLAALWARSGSDSRLRVAPGTLDATPYSTIARTSARATPLPAARLRRARRMEARKRGLAVSNSSARSSLLTERNTRAERCMRLRGTLHGRAGRSASLSLKTVRSGCEAQCASCARRRSDGARSPGVPASPRPCGSARMSARESRAEAQRRGEETDGPRQLDPRRAARCLLWLTSVGSALNIRSTVSSTVTPQQ